MSRSITTNSQQTPREPAQFAVESNSVNFIPHNLRHGRAWTLFPMWFGANCALLTIAVGSTALFPSLSVPWAIVALVLGSLIGGIFMAYHSAQGPKLGIPQMIQSRAQFGLYGANLPLLIVVAMYVGFFAASDVVAGQAIQELFHVSLTITILIGAAASLVLVLFGYNAVHWFERAATPLFLAVFIIYTVVLIVTGPPAASTTVASAGHSAGLAAAPFLIVLSTAVIYQISYAPYVADYSRYLPEKTGTTATFVWTYAGIVISTAWLSIIGVVLAHWYPTLDLLSQVVTPANHLGTGFRDLMLITIALGLIGVNALNIYGASLSSMTIVTSVVARQRSSVALRFSFIIPITIISTYLAFLERANVLTFFENILSFLLYFLIPWTAVNLIDFYFIRRGQYDVDGLLSRSGPYGKVSWIGLTAYLIGCLAEIPFVNTTVFVGPAASALGGADISWIVGVVFAGGSYLVLHRSPMGRRASLQGRGQGQTALPSDQEPVR